MRKLTVIYFFFLSIFIFLFINFGTNLNSLSKNNENDLIYIQNINEDSNEKFSFNRKNSENNFSKINLNENMFMTDYINNDFEINNNKIINKNCGIF